MNEFSSDAFRRYAIRFRGTRNLAAYVLSGKFAGSRAAFQALVEDAAAILREVEPDRNLPLGAEAGETADLASDIPGLAFWSWSGDRAASGAAVKPVLLSIAGASGDEHIEAARAAGAISDVEADRNLAGAIFEDFASLSGAALFRSTATQYPGLDTLTPRAVYYAFAGLWGGTFPSAWREERQAPRLANPDGPASAGALVRLTGAALVNRAAPYADETWPYHLAGTCLCVSGAAARLSFVSPSAITAQIPAAAEPGPRALVFYRAGRASNFTLIHVSEFSAGAYQGPVLEARR